MQLQRLFRSVTNAYLSKERSHFQQNELVFIGRNLYESLSLIKQQLDDCLAELIIRNKFSLPNLPW